MGYEEANIEGKAVYRDDHYLYIDNDEPVLLAFSIDGATKLRDYLNRVLPVTT
jgi:hypothetical protein